MSALRSKSVIGRFGKRSLFMTLFASLLILSALSTSNLRVNASPLITDQQCSTTSSTTLSGIGTHEPAGQIFVPTQTSIVAFSIFIQSQNGAPTSMTANIRVGGVGGGTLGSFLFTVPSAFGGTSGDWFQVQFPSGIQLTPGSTYAIDLTDNSASSGIVWHACSTPYTGGCGYSNGVCSSSGSWAFIEYAGDFSLGFSSSAITLAQGSTGSVTVLVGSQNNFASPVTLSFSAASGISGSFNANPVTPAAGGTASSTLTIFVPGSVPVGTYPLTITGTAGPLTHSATLTLYVISPTAADFSLASSGTVLVSAGSTVTSSIIVSSFGSFNSPVALTAAWVGTPPAASSATLSTPVTPPTGGSATSTLTMTAGASTPGGAYTLRVTGTSGSLSHTADVSVIVGPAVTVTTTTTPLTSDFSISATSTTISMLQGLSGSTTVIVTSLDGFNLPVLLTASWVGNAPSGVTYALPTPISPPPGGAGSSPVAITSTSQSSTGSFTLRITGTSLTLTHFVDLIIQINQAGPRCIIATATYGSELAPEVQLLRGFRDNAIMQTHAGSNFMVAFNDWYYSFSPNVANYIANHWVERSVMKGVLYPLVGMLGLSYGAFSAADSYPELAAVMAGLLASSMIGAFYVGLPVSVLRIKLKRLRGLSSRPLELALGIALLSALAGLNIGEFVNSPTLLMLSAASVVLSTLFLSASVTSSKIASSLVRKK